MQYSFLTYLLKFILSFFRSVFITIPDVLKKNLCSLIIKCILLSDLIGQVFKLLIKCCIHLLCIFCIRNLHF